MAKYIFITGGVVSSLGKGVAAAGCGTLLQSRGYTVHARKFDPYLNIDPGTMSPFQHGEVYVTNDGYETDLDLGYYERFLGAQLSRNDSVSGGRIYWDVLNAERRGDYLGATVQMIPHVSNKIKEYISAPTNTDFVVCEIGGTVGDIEGKIFLESIRQFANDVGRHNVMFIHLTLAPYLEKSGELKTKPTQMSARELLENGIQADMLIVRTPRMLTASERDKIGMFCNLPAKSVISGIDVDNIYKIPLAYEAQHVFDIIADHFDLPHARGDMTRFERIERYLSTDLPTVNIGVVGKYFNVPDAYKSLNDALFHAGIQNNVHVNIHKLDAENFTPDACRDIDGILVAGGFGARGVDGKIAAAGENGQFRTPRHIINMMVQLMKPTLKDRILDPAMGSAGFLLESSTYISTHYAKELMKAENAKYYKSGMFSGFDTDQSMLRIGAMNMMLHGVEDPNITYQDSLSGDNN